MDFIVKMREYSYSCLDKMPSLFKLVIRWEFIIVILYTILISFISYFHEPWLDEAQAWLIARDNNIWDIMFNAMHFEGSPPLWHIILYIPAHLGANYYTIKIVSIVISLTGTILLLYCSPFPFWIRACLPFTYFLFYQYGIIARSYVLIGPLLFWIAYRWDCRHKEIIKVIIPLILLAFTSMHGLMISLATSFFIFIEVTIRPLSKSIGFSFRYLFNQNFSYWLIYLFAVILAIWGFPDKTDSPELGFLTKS